MKSHGSSSENQPKKSYGLEFYDDDLNSLDLQVFGTSLNRDTEGASVF